MLGFLTQAGLEMKGISVQNVEQNQPKSPDELNQEQRLELRDAPENVFYWPKKGLADGLLNWIPRDDSLELHQIFVRREKRKQGIGTRLLRMLIKEAKKRGISQIITLTGAPGNEHRDWLVSCGFSKANERCWNLKL